MILQRTCENVRSNPRYFGMSQPTPTGILHFPVLEGSRKQILTGHQGRLLFSHPCCFSLEKTAAKNQLHFPLVDWLMKVCQRQSF